MDYFIVAGSPQWIERNEPILIYCLKHKIPISFIGIGTNNLISKWHRKLLSLVAKSQLCEIVLTRDSIAKQIMIDIGFKNVIQILDPAFFINYSDIIDFKDDKRHSENYNVLCWRNFQNESLLYPSGVPTIRNKPLLFLRIKINREFNKKKKIVLKRDKSRDYSLDKYLLKTFKRMDDPKRVIVHSNYEIKNAERLFGKEYVYYCTNYIDMLKIYAQTKNYIGTRIHGAISAIVNGASTLLIYHSTKVKAFSEGIDKLSEDYPEIKNFTKVLNVSKISNEIFDKQLYQIDIYKIENAIYKNLSEIQKILRNLEILGSYMI